MKKSDSQRSLFATGAYGHQEPAPLARSEDPIESKLAASQIEETVADLQAWAVQCVKDHPGKTAMELSVLYEQTDSRKIGRRLGECEKLGLIRRGESRECSITKRRAATWVPK